MKRGPVGDIERRFGVELIPSARVSFMAWDVIGKISAQKQREIDDYRPVGILFTFFESHRARLDDFGRRLADARRRLIR